MTNIQSKSFQISLAEADTPYTISRLLRHAMNHLKRIASHPIYINELYVLDADHHSLEDAPMVKVGYWALDTEMIELAKENLSFRREYKLSDKVEEAVYTPGSDIPAQLRMLEYRLPQGDNQSDAIALIESLADHLEEYHIEAVTDLILHSLLDKDALDHPFVRVYYRDRYEEK